MPSKTVEYVHYHDGGVPGSRPVLTGPDAKPTFDALPMIDMRRMFSDSLEERKQLAAEVGAACRDVGFFYALNHDVPEELIQDTFKSITRFFNLPSKIKMDAYIRKSSVFRGYEPLLDVRLDPTTRGDLKEAFLMAEDATEPEQKAESTGQKEPRNQWPSAPEAAFLRPAMYAYYTRLLAFSRQMLRVFALALDLPEDHFDSVTTFPMAAIRALHYPPQEVSTDIGIGAHTDYCWFTLVCQTEVPALQVLNDNGIWVPAPYVPRTFVVNVGDFLKLITGGTWQSTVHRVCNVTGEERYSMPFFFSPNEDATMSVIEQCRQPGKIYEDISVREYYQARLQAARKKNSA